MFDQWLDENEPYLRDIYYGIILPNQVSSSLSYRQFCRYSYDIHRRG